MRFLLAILLLAVNASAHIGSPNVFFEGRTGAHTVRVVLRPPIALPGHVQADVRIEGDGVTGVTLQPAYLAASDEAAPPAVRATVVAGDAHAFSGVFFILRSGAHRVRITLECNGGDSFVDVPLQAASLERPKMPPGLGAILIALGVVLFSGAIAIIRVATRSIPGTIIGALLLVTGVAFSGQRWREMDRDFRASALAKPVAVDTSIRTEAEQHILRISLPASAPIGSAWDTLVTDHGKLMHLFLIRESGITAFAHLHPVRRDSRTFEGVLPPLPAGDYQLYAEVTHENGQSDTLLGSANLPVPVGLPKQSAWTMQGEVLCQSPAARVADSLQPNFLDADDSWHIATAVGQNRASPLMGGGKMLLLTPGQFAAGRDTVLRLSVLMQSGGPAELQTYMGMAGHCVIRRSDGSVFTHLHPSGTFSMAAENLLIARAQRAQPGASLEPAVSKAVTSATPGEVLFPYAFPQSGKYRIWVQVRTAAGILTGVFDVSVGEL